MYAAKPARHSGKGGGDGVDKHLNNLVATSTTITTGPPPPHLPNPTIAGNRLVGGATRGSVGERHYHSQFRWDTNGIIRPLARGGTSIVDSISTFVETSRVSNPLVHGQGAMDTLARVLNGMLNGAIMGTVYADAISSVIGASIEGSGGAVTNAQ
jgi:hypothetical protein